MVLRKWTAKTHIRRTECYRPAWRIRPNCRVDCAINIHCRLINRLFIITKSTNPAISWSPVAGDRDVGVLRQPSEEYCLRRDKHLDERPWPSRSHASTPTLSTNTQYVIKITFLFSFLRSSSSLLRSPAFETGYLVSRQLKHRNVTWFPVWLALYILAT